MPTSKFYKKEKDSNEVLHEVELEFKEKYGMWVRPGSSDYKMILECHKDYPKAEFAGKNILDLGANIGGFTVRALRGGAKNVVAVEPDEFNFEMLKLNSSAVKLDDAQSCTLIEAACIAGEAKTITFYLNGSSNSACSASINKLRGAVIEKTVKAVSFGDLLEEHRPDFIKMDIEGAEYELMAGTAIPDFVKELAIELHGFRKDQKPLQKSLLEHLKDGWTCIHEEAQIVFNYPSLVLAHFVRK